VSRGKKPNPKDERVTKGGESEGGWERKKKQKQDAEMGRGFHRAKKRAKEEPYRRKRWETGEFREKKDREKRKTETSNIGKKTLKNPRICFLKVK